MDINKLNEKLEGLNKALKEDAVELSQVKTEALDLCDEAKQVVITKLQDTIKEIENTDTSNMYEIICKIKRVPIESISNLSGGIVKYIKYIEDLIDKEPNRREDLEAHLAQELQYDMKEIKKNLKRLSNLDESLNEDRGFI